MKKLELKICFLLFLILSLTVLPLVSASVSVWHNDETYWTFNLNFDVTAKGYGLKWAGNGEYLYSWLTYHKTTEGVNSGTGSVYSAVFEEYPASTWTWIANSSNSFAFSSFNTNANWYNFLYEDMPYLNASRNYRILTVMEGTPTYWIKVGCVTNNPSNTVFVTDIFTTPSWNEGAKGYGLMYRVLTDTDPAPTPTPSPSPSPSPTPFTYQGDIWEALTPYGTLILPLVLILLVALLCGRYAGVWGFFAGLNIAAILVYAIMGAAYLPLWGLVILALVDGLLLFGKISGRM